MLSTDIPAQFPIPFGNSAGGGYIRAIPTASQIGIHAGYASLTDGFVPLNMTPIGAGGVPPFGQDMNGLMKQTTAWARWVGVGGPVTYDATQQTAIGGYPKGAVVFSATTFGLQWLSTAENNVTNPDAAGAGWQAWGPQGSSYYNAGGTANALTVTTFPASASYRNGQAFYVKILAVNTGAATLDAGGGAKAINNQNGSPLVAGDLVAGSTVLVVFDATTDHWRVVGPILNIHGQTLNTNPAALDEFLMWNVTTSAYQKTTGGAIAGLAAVSTDSQKLTLFLGCM